MDLNEAREKIKNVKSMASDMVIAGELSAEIAVPVCLIIIENLLKCEGVSGNYEPD